MASWEEIKKLAADLHRVQLGESAKRLSERNCVEIVAKLIADSIISVVHTLDGKEYVTKEYLTTQIRNETIGNGGRIALTDLQQILNVQYQHVEDRANTIVDSDSSFILCLGQLITKNYLDSIADEVDERLRDEGGRLTLGQLTKSYDLPTEFLKNEIFKRLASDGQLHQTGRIHARADVSSSDGQVIFYTDSYVEEQRATVRGALAALTRVMPISKLLSEINVEAALFFKSFDEIQESGDVRGSIVGGRNVERAIYVPDIYTSRMNSYLKDFFYHNGYLEYSTIKKLAVTDVDQCLTRLFDEGSQKTMVRLQDTVLSLDTWDQIESAVEEALSKRLWADVATHSNVAASSNDIRQMATLLKKRHLSEWTLCGDTIFYKNAELVSACGRSFETVLNEKAIREAPTVMKILRQQQQPQQQTAKKPAKSGKKRGKGGKRGGDDDDSDIDQSSGQSDAVEFMSIQQLADALKANENLQQEYSLDLCPDELLLEIAEKLRPTLNAKYRQQLESIFLASNAPDQQQGGVEGKKSHLAFEETFRRLYQNIFLFDADAGSLFTDNVAEQLRVHLIRTLCTELTNLAVCFYNRDAKMQNAEQMSAKVRDANIEEMPGVAREAFKKLTASLNVKELAPFYDAVDAVSASDVCSLKQIRTPDKRIRAGLCEHYRKELEDQLNECVSDPAAGLLISCLLLLTKTSDHSMVHASGKFVPQLISCLKDKTSPEIYALLCETQNAVVHQLRNKDDASLANRALEKLQQLKGAILQQ